MKLIQITLDNMASKILEEYCKANNMSQQNAVNMIIVNYNTRLKKEKAKEWNQKNQSGLG